MAQSSVLNSLARIIIAVVAIGTICAAILLNIIVPEWFVVFATSIVVFYFGTHNGKSEQTITQAGEIASAALTNSVTNSLPHPGVGTTTTTVSSTEATGVTK